MFAWFEWTPYRLEGIAGLAAGGDEEAATGDLGFRPLLALLMRAAEHAPTSLTATQRAGLQRLLMLLTNQAADCRAAVDADPTLMVDIAGLSVMVLPAWFALLCPLGSASSAHGHQPAARAPEGMQDGLATLVLRLSVGLTALLFSVCHPDVHFEKERAIDALASAAASCPDAIQGETRGTCCACFVSLLGCAQRTWSYPHACLLCGWLLCRQAQWCLARLGNRQPLLCLCRCRHGRSGAGHTLHPAAAACAPCARVRGNWAQF